MNSTERVYAAQEGRPVDRPPVFPQIGDHAGILAGLTYDVMYRDAEKAAEAHLAALRRYGFDVVTIQVEPSWPVSEACGSTVAYPPDKNPWVTDFAVKNDEDVDRITVPDFMATQSTRVLIEGTRILAERAGVPVVAFMTGPLTFGLQLMPYEQVMKKIGRDPEFVHRLVRKSVDVIVAYGQALKEAGATIFAICEHDVQMMSPRHIREFSLRYLPEVLSVYDYNVLHMCGDVNPHLDANAAQFAALDGLNAISVGPEVDIARLRRLLGGKIGVAGNIDHLALLPLGTPAEIEAAVHAAIAASEGDPRFIVAPGCEITSDTPAPNVEAFVAAARTYAGAAIK
ncbi:MAG: uroporphyrinogen decarboxylase family protein [Chloroflexota bacterium]|nr:uroporphyrinogen decarboxylase family protein [Chloroflexota bacterium]